MDKITTVSERETFELGKRLAEQVNGGDMLALQGELGSGKTVFVRGLARGLGIKETEITSPTFVLVKLYALPGKRLKLLHFDLYRLEDGSELEELGFTDILKSQEHITVIEWPEKAVGLIPEYARFIKFEHGDKPHERGITL